MSLPECHVGTEVFQLTETFKFKVFRKTVELLVKIQQQFYSSQAERRNGDRSETEYNTCLGGDCDWSDL